MQHHSNGKSTPFKFRITKKENDEIDFTSLRMK